MQIKSWQVVLAGNIPIIGSLLWLILQEFENRSFTSLEAVTTLFAIFFYFIAFLLPILLLKSRKEKINKIGGLISIFYGIGILFIKGITLEIISFFSILGFLVAGIHYFWKKV